MWLGWKKPIGPLPRAQRVGEPATRWLGGVVCEKVDPPLVDVTRVIAFCQHLAFSSNDSPLRMQ